MSEGKQDEMTQQDDDSSDDGLWNEFESCAASGLDFIFLKSFNKKMQNF